MGLSEVPGEPLLEKELKKRRGKKGEEREKIKEGGKEGVGERNNSVTKIQCLEES